MRRALVVGAQKLYLSLDEAIKFAKQLARDVHNKRFSCDVAICPSFMNLTDVAKILRDSQIGIGAQNVHQEASGAFTGQVSIKELLDRGVKSIIVGHSELRNHQNETNGAVNDKVKICLRNGVTPIACVGETREEKDSGRSTKVVETTIREIFKDIPQYDRSFKKQMADVVVAYEPVWAIKAGKDDKETRAATAAEANFIHEFIRDILASMYGSDIAEKIRIVYGGSVSQENTRELLEQPSIDGLLVGTASIKEKLFFKILKIAQEVVSKRPPFLPGRHPPKKRRPRRFYKRRSQVSMTQRSYPIPRQPHQREGNFK